ncbi:MAG: right-handed parallel beta-helix repeat-containing protein, partial [Kiritimatiellae bacterium]|nr:right-handed parallel beta-helix repeat-containing protein [Kiritimatiellia bacterium]
MKNKNLIVLLMLVMFAVVSFRAQAATLNVGAGETYTTIAAAITAAAASGDIISIEDAVHTEQGIVISKSLTIQGKGVDSTTVQAAASRSNATDRIFLVSSAVIVTIKDMTLQYGYLSGVEDDGGAIALTAAGDLTIQDCVLTMNDVGDNGGALYASHNLGATCTVQRCTISDNTAGGTGGGIYLFYGALFTMENSTISGNSAAGNGGGFAENTYWQISIIRNCTFSGNSAVGHGGGAAVYGADYWSLGGRYCSFYNCSFIGNDSGNYGGGLRSDNVRSSVELLSCVFAGNTSTNTISEAYSMAGNSLVVSNCVWEGDDKFFNVPVLGENHDLGDGGDAKVSATLADNGGVTMTHALLAGSICITNGSNVASLTTDQRGSGYVRVIDSIADVGAYEYLSGPTQLVYSAGVFNEDAGLNDGSIDNNVPILIDLEGDETFTGSDSDDFASGGTPKVVISNLPNNLTG